MKMNLVEQQPNLKMLVLLLTLYWSISGSAVINYFRMDCIEVALFSEKNNVVSSLTIKVNKTKVICADLLDFILI